MSYVIQVWEQPVPASMEEAEGILERLLGEGAGSPSPRLDQLVKTLWARYPSDLDSDCDDPVWEDSFPRGDREPLKVETLAVATSHLDEVLPVVTKTATELGLVAYDPQFGTVYLPGGRTLGRVPSIGQGARAGSAAPVPAPARASVLLDVDGATTRLLAGLGPRLSAYGFAWKKLANGDGWVRAFPGGQQKIAPLVDAHGGSVGFTLQFSALLAAVDEPVNRFKQYVKPVPVTVLWAPLSSYLKAAGHPAVGLFKSDGAMGRITANTEVRLDAAIAALEEIIPPILTEMQGFGSIDGLWQNALDEARGRRQAHFTESIEAKLVAGGLLGASELTEVADAELVRYEASLARRRAGATPAALKMLAQEEGEVKASLARLAEFARTLAAGQGGR